MPLVYSSGNMCILLNLRRLAPDMFFEIYNQQPHLNAESWKGFVCRVLKNIGWVGEFTLEIRIKKSQVHYYAHCDKDLNSLSTELFPFIVKREDMDQGGTFRENRRWIPWLRVKSEDNILSLRDRHEFKKNRTLNKLFFHFGRLGPLRYCKVEFLFLDAKGSTQYRNKLYFGGTPFRLLDIDFSKSVSFKKRSIPLYLKIQKVAPLFCENLREAFLEVLGFPFLPRGTYFPLSSFEINKHSLIVGQTGTGKSKFIESFVNEIERWSLPDEYSVIILDPHADLYRNFVATSVNIDFFRTACSLFSSYTDANISTELTLLLFKTVVRDQFNPKMERVLKYTLFVLYLTKQMSLDTLRRFLSEIEFRKELLRKLPENQEKLLEFFDTDFIELQTKYYEVAVMPIIVLLDELSFLPSSSFEDNRQLDEFVNNNSLTFLSLNKILLGEKATKLLAGLLIQQIFLLAQAGAFKKKVIFIIDEVSVVENDALGPILSEARKFNLSLFLSQQYLSQVDEDLLKSIVTNVYNFFVFKVSEEDARLLARNLEMEFSSEILAEGRTKGDDEQSLKTKIVTTLNPRECLVRVYSNGSFFPCFKARTMDIE